MVFNIHGLQWLFMDRWDLIISSRLKRDVFSGPLYYTGSLFSCGRRDLTLIDRKQVVLFILYIYFGRPSPVVDFFGICKPIMRLSWVIYDVCRRHSLPWYVECVVIRASCCVRPCGTVILHCQTIVVELQAWHTTSAL